MDSSQEKSEKLSFMQEIHCGSRKDEAKEISRIQDFRTRDNRYLF